MPIDLPLNTMSLADKLEAMESLWADLSKSPVDVPTPAWHREILAERRKLVAEGKAQFVSWDTVLTELRSELRGNSPT